MIYKGKNKHTQEELETIIDEMEEKLIDVYTELQIQKNKQIELGELVREVYNSAKLIQQYENENNLSAEDIVNNVIKSFEEFSKNYKFRL